LRVLNYWFFIFIWYRTALHGSTPKSRWLYNLVTLWCLYIFTKRSLNDAFVTHWIAKHSIRNSDTKENRFRKKIPDKIRRWSHSDIHTKVWYYYKACIHPHWNTFYLNLSCRWPNSIFVGLGWIFDVQIFLFWPFFRNFYETAMFGVV